MPAKLYIMAIVMAIPDKEYYSIAQARNNLAALVHHVESDGPIQLTRWGKPVAVLVSRADYERLKGEGSEGLWSSIERFRSTHDLADEPLLLDEVEGWRDRSEPRQVEF